MENRNYTPKKQAYELIKPQIPERLTEVLEAIKEIQPCHYKAVAKYLQARDNNTTNRISELEKIGLIKKVGEVEQENKRSLSLFAVCDEVEAREEQGQLLEKYQAEREAQQKAMETPDLPEITYNLIKNRITRLTDMIRLINKFRV